MNINNYLYQGVVLSSFISFMCTLNPESKSVVRVVEICMGLLEKKYSGNEAIIESLKEKSWLALYPLFEEGVEIDTINLFEQMFYDNFEWLSGLTFISEFERHLLYIVRYLQVVENSSPVLSRKVAESYCITIKKEVFEYCKLIKRSEVPAIKIN